MNNRIRLLLLILLGITVASCEEGFEGRADGRVLVVTQDVEMVTDINDKFAIGQGEITLNGISLPSDFYIVSKGLIYGTDASGLKIKSHSYNNSNYNSYYGCFQPYTYTAISNTNTPLMI